MAEGNGKKVVGPADPAEAARDFGLRHATHAEAAFLLNNEGLMDEVRARIDRISKETWERIEATIRDHAKEFNRASLKKRTELNNKPGMDPAEANTKAYKYAFEAVYGPFLYDQIDENVAGKSSAFYSLLKLVLPATLKLGPLGIKGRAELEVVAKLLADVEGAQVGGEKLAARSVESEKECTRLKADQEKLTERIDILEPVFAALGTEKLDEALRGLGGLKEREALGRAENDDRYDLTAKENRVYEVENKVYRASDKLRYGHPKLFERSRKLLGGVEEFFALMSAKRDFVPDGLFSGNLDNVYTALKNAQAAVADFKGKVPTPMTGSSRAEIRNYFTKLQELFAVEIAGVLRVVQKIIQARIWHWEEEAQNRLKASPPPAARHDSEAELDFAKNLHEVLKLDDWSNESQNLLGRFNAWEQSLLASKVELEGGELDGERIVGIREVYEDAKFENSDKAKALRVEYLKLAEGLNSGVDELLNFEVTDEVKSILGFNVDAFELELEDAQVEVLEFRTKHKIKLPSDDASFADAGAYVEATRQLAALVRGKMEELGELVGRPLEALRKEAVQNQGRQNELSAEISRLGSFAGGVYAERTMERLAVLQALKAQAVEKKRLLNLAEERGNLKQQNNSCRMQLNGLLEEKGRLEAQSAFEALENEIASLEEDLKNPIIALLKKAFPGMKFEGGKAVSEAGGTIKAMAKAIEYFRDEEGETVAKVRDLAGNFAEATNGLISNTNSQLLISQEIVSEGETLAELSLNTLKSRIQSKLQGVISSEYSIRDRSKKGIISAQEMNRGQAQLDKKRAELSDLETVINSVQEEAKAFHQKLEPLMSCLGDIEKAGVKIGLAGVEESHVKDVLAQFRKIKINANFSPAGLVAVSNSLEGLIGDRTQIAALVDQLEKAKEALALNSNVLDFEVAERVVMAMVAEQYPDCDPGKQRELAREIIKVNLMQHKTEKEIGDLVAEASPEVLNAARVAGVRRVLIDFSYGDENNKKQPFRGLTPSNFENWASIEKLIPARINSTNEGLSNGFVLLAGLEVIEERAHESSSAKDKPAKARISEERVELQKKMFQLLAESQEFAGAHKRLHEDGVRAIVQEAYDDCFKRARGAMRAHYRNYQADGSTMDYNKVLEINARLENLFERYKRGEKHSGMKPEIFNREFEDILKEAQEYGIEKQIRFSAKNKAFGEVWHSPEMQWVKNELRNVGSVAARKGGMALLSGVGLGLAGTWGLTKTAVKSSLALGLAAPVMALRYPLYALGKIPIFGINAFRKWRGKPKWEPYTLKGAFQNDVKRVTGFVGGEAKTRWAGTKESFGSAGGRIGAQKYERKRRDEVAGVRSPDELAADAKFYGDKATSTPIEQSGAPIINLSEFSKKLEQLNRINDGNKGSGLVGQQKREEARKAA